MNKGDILKLEHSGSLVTFVEWLNDDKNTDTIVFSQHGSLYYTHYKSIVAINGIEVGK